MEHTTETQLILNGLYRNSRQNISTLAGNAYRKYVDEVAFRLMNKDRQDEMFEIILSHVV